MGSVAGKKNCFLAPLRVPRDAGFRESATFDDAACPVCSAALRSATHPAKCARAPLSNGTCTLTYRSRVVVVLLPFPRPLGKLSNGPMRANRSWASRRHRRAAENRKRTAVREPLGGRHFRGIKRDLLERGSGRFYAQRIALGASEARVRAGVERRGREQQSCPSICQR